MTGAELPLVLIAAVARNGVIGRDNGMPWRLPGDLAHFRAATMGKPVIMGRTTFAAIGKPLPGRQLIVLSRDAGFHAEGVEVAGGLDDAIARAAARRSAAAEIMVAGGASVYAALMPRATTLLVTEIDIDPAGDALFPPIDPSAWLLTERVHAEPAQGDGVPYAFARYERRTGGPTR